MESFILRVCAYHGEPKRVGNVYARSGVSHDTPVEAASIVNDPDKDVVKDLNYASTDAVNDPGGRSDYVLDSLIEDFQVEYGCKVNYSDPVLKDGVKTLEFDVFEPGWSEQLEAEDVIDDLTARLVDWVQGYPTGR